MDKVGFRIWVEFALAILWLEDFDTNLGHLTQDYFHALKTWKEQPHGGTPRRLNTLIGWARAMGVPHGRLAKQEKTTSHSKFWWGHGQIMSIECGAVCALIQFLRYNWQISSWSCSLWMQKGEYCNNNGQGIWSQCTITPEMHLINLRKLFLFSI